MAILQLFGSRSYSQEIKVGDKVPNFTLQDQEGKSFSIDTVIGKYPLVIYFYPKDETSGCTKEACSFRDAYESFNQYGAKVIGISGDNVKSHQQFASHHQLNFTLLSDPGNKVRKLFGVPKTMMIPGRVTYIVDKNGVVVHTFNSMTKADQHVEESLAALKKMQ
ncbi:peroxiredoxin Q/BCP [Chitinophaga costaii]|uniref:thioredoxin-dependent peroxiredoxin n=2 Tax=Chitinophaga costaii TaxID=1335309 RepID=A0A1C4FDN7_9BACT|nr:peroxiredoxin [Chitinophaga costaii]SCC53775.1 peroxiredoxin Q/BCP [Chitinophaga costaii]